MPKLIDICDKINMGQSPDSSSYNKEADGLPFFQGNADFGKVHPIARVWCNAPKKIAYPNDILISVRAPIGALNIADQECCIGRGLAAISVDNTVCDRMYLWYALQNKANELNSKGTGSTFKAITKVALYDTEVQLPSLEQQRFIACRLSNVQDSIDICKTIIEKLDLSVKSRFVEMFGDPKINPYGYPIHELSEYIEFLTSGSRGWAKYCVDEGSEWFITIKNVKDCRISTYNMQPVDAPDNAEARRTKVQEGDLLISITADLGRTGVVTKEIANHGAYINQHLTCIRLNQEELEPLYVAHFMESSAGKEQFVSKNQSAVKAGLNFNSINTLKILVPPKKAQEDFLTFVQQTDKSKYAVESLLNKLTILRASLMQEYFG